jgi:hypothetical protein
VQPPFVWERRNDLHPLVYEFSMAANQIFYLKVQFQNIQQFGLGVPFPFTRPFINIHQSIQQIWFKVVIQN